MTSRKLLLATLITALASSAFAEKADRDKPVNLEADRVTVDDIKKVHIFEGNVVLTKGTLVIRTDKLVVTQDANGFQRGTAFGGADGLARFKQKREGKNEYIEGESERIEHDDRAEKTEFFVRAHVKSGLDDVRGQYINYDGRTENYVVTNGGSTSSKDAKNNKDNRVRAIIQPRNKGDKAESPSSPATTGQR